MSALSSHLTPAIDQTFRYSHFAERSLREDPGLLARLESYPGLRPDFSGWQTELRSLGADTACVEARLLAMRRDLMLSVMLRDIGQLASYEELVADLSNFADLALTAAIETHRQALFKPEESDGGFSVVAMGKLGGCELNASSDIDIIFVCDDEKLDSLDPLNQLARRVTRTLEPPRAEHFVFRVDTRLRPFGDAGPLVPSLSFLESYFVQHGRMWERIAWLRARVVHGPLKPDIEALIQPFVYRRYLDFDALAGMRELHQQLREEKQDPRNIKLGRGGIRELEFGTQLRQLIRGGHQPLLRERNTLRALETLTQVGLIRAELTTQLAEDYRFLRRLEHMLQYRDDQQTQRLPESEADIAALAEAMGLSDPEQLLTILEAVRERVRTYFDETLAGVYGASDRTRSMVAQPSESTASEAPTDADRPAWFSYAEQSLSSARVRALSAVAQERLKNLIDRAAHLARAHEEAETAFKRTLDLLTAIAGRSSYLALLSERPQVLARLVDLAAASDWGVRYVTQHPLLLDELIDPRTLELRPDYAHWHAHLQARLQACGEDVERAMDAVRHFQQEETFRLLLADLAGQLTIETLSDHLSALADTVVDVVLGRTLHDAGLLPTLDTKQSGLAILAYGRWGGKELGYASDLDLVFLLDDACIEQRDRYTRAVQRLQSWLTTMTAAGRAYEIDARLRPDGQAGLLITTVSAFRRYQLEKAWTWEHQALTRARFAAGDQRVGHAFEAIRREVLARPRDWPALRQEILDMRARVAEGHPNRQRDTHFDLKHDPGGLVDIEFGVQALILREAARHAALLDNLGNIALARMAGKLELVPIPIAEAAADAYRSLRARQHALRLRGAATARVPLGELSLEREAGRAWWDAVMRA